MPKTYYLCCSCERVVDENGKLIELPNEELPLHKLSLTDCELCLNYSTWEHSKYFNIHMRTEGDSNPR